MWDDGTPLADSDYSNWKESNEPDESGDCVIMIGEFWYDYTCRGSFQHICQKCRLYVRLIWTKLSQGLSFTCFKLTHCISYN